jgi:murein DD-endopeptidase MepM/ murein hydrolase activator NlpD
MTAINFPEFLKRISSKPLYVLDSKIPLQSYIPIDLSESNQELHKVDTSSSKDLETYIFNYIKSNKGRVAYGGYTEVRNLYTRSPYFNNRDSASQRNIHLGMDLWIEAGTPVFAPLDATVHSFANNTNYGDYGPTIILKHNINDIEFYTLYGHLSKEAVANMSIGHFIRQGDQIATLGDASVNGDYAPHLHFQIIKDIQDYKGDYPGVCSKEDLAFYANNCPDPNVLLKLM